MESRLSVPPLIRDVFELLAREEEDALVQLAAIRTLRGWLGGRERLGLAAARAQEYSWEEIGAAQGRPRQALQRQEATTSSSARRLRGARAPAARRGAPMRPRAREDASEPLEDLDQR